MGWFKNQVLVPTRGFNPVEKAFSKLRVLLRMGAGRKVDCPGNNLGKLPHAITPRECANFFAAAGYDLFEKQPIDEGASVSAFYPNRGKGEKEPYTGLSKRAEQRFDGAPNQPCMIVA